MSIFDTKELMLWLEENPTAFINAYQSTEEVRIMLYGKKEDGGLRATDCFYMRIPITTPKTQGDN